MKRAKFTKSLTIVVDEETLARLKAITDEKQISMGQYARHAILDALDRLNRRNSNG